jgi:hypothetical protein
MGHEGKFRELQADKLWKETGKIEVGNILRYLVDHPAFEDLDIPHKKWILDQIAILDPASTFFGQYNSEAELLAEPTAGIREGAYAYVKNGANLILYIWDSVALSWGMDGGTPEPISFYYPLLWVMDGVTTTHPIPDGGAENWLLTHVNRVTTGVHHIEIAFEFYPDTREIKIRDGYSFDAGQEIYFDLTFIYN